MLYIQIAQEKGVNERYGVTWCYIHLVPTPNTAPWCVDGTSWVLLAVCFFLLIEHPSTTVGTYLMAAPLDPATALG